MGCLLQTVKSAMTHKGIASREAIRSRVMSVPSGRHGGSAKSGFNSSLQVFTARCVILKHRTPLRCPALPLHAVVGAEKIMGRGQERAKCEREVYGCAKRCSQQKTPKLWFAWPCEEGAREVLQPPRCPCVSLQAAKMGKTRHTSDLIPPHKHAK